MLSRHRRGALTALLVATAPGCLHVTHPAEVEPGFALGVTAGGGVTVETHEGDRPNERHALYDLQIDGRYGWRFRDGGGLLVGLMLPVVVRDYDLESEVSELSLAQVGADVYWQVGSDPDWGVGLVASLLPRAYGMVGHEWDLAPQVSFRMDGALGLGAGLDLWHDPQPVVWFTGTARLSLSAWQLGLWCDGGYAPWGYYRGEDALQVASSGVAGGAFVVLRFSEL